jgi:HEAT repeat protein
MTEAPLAPTLPHVDHPSDVPGLGLAELLEALASSDPAIRAGAIVRARAEAGVEEVLIQSLSDPSAQVRAAAVRALTRMEGRRATEALIEVSAGDLSILVRAEAVAALGRILEARTPPAAQKPGVDEQAGGTEEDA